MAPQPQTFSIDIVRRPGGREHVASNATYPVFVIPPQEGVPAPWHGARTLLTALAAHRGTATWDATSAEARPLVALIHQEWTDRLTDRERETRDGFACSCPA